MNTVRLPLTSHYLMGARDRKYVFATAGDSDIAVRVRRYERGLCVREWMMAKDAARKLWAWLVKIGYTKW